MNCTLRPYLVHLLRRAKVLRRWVAVTPAVLDLRLRVGQIKEPFDIQPADPPVVDSARFQAGVYGCSIFWTIQFSFF